ncbi:hypothetical protein J6590_070299 [Homalodisca vitripennis]|nr:hypothetical protein J6590_070299 [Homalodisca vitripennis]
MASLLTIRLARSRFTLLGGRVHEECSGTFRCRSKQPHTVMPVIKFCHIIIHQADGFLNGAVRTHTIPSSEGNLRDFRTSHVVNQDRLKIASSPLCRRLWSPPSERNSGLEVVISTLFSTTSARPRTWLSPVIVALRNGLDKEVSEAGTLHLMFFLPLALSCHLVFLMTAIKVSSVRLGSS